MGEKELLVVEFSSDDASCTLIVVEFHPKALLHGVIGRRIAAWTEFFWFTLVGVLIAMAEDPASTRRCWRKMLAPCQNADRLYAASHPTLTPSNLPSLTAIISAALS